MEQMFIVLEKSEAFYFYSMLFNTKAIIKIFNFKTKVACIYLTFFKNSKAYNEKHKHSILPLDSPFQLQALFIWGSTYELIMFL